MLNAILAFLTAAGLSFDPCAKLEPMDECHAVPHGVILAPGSASVESYRDAMAQAAERFERYFGRAAPAAALVVTEDGKLIQQSALAAIGIDVVLPWITPEGKAAQRRDSVGRQLEAARPDMPVAQLQALTERALAAAPDLAMTAELEIGTVAHELCHLHLISAFDLRPPETHAEPIYGGLASDWLDEAAAVLCESEAMLANREAMLQDMARSDRLIPLAEFLTMAHPMKNVVLTTREAGRIQMGGVTVLSGEEAQSALNDAGGLAAPAFYAQALGFARFLIEASDQVDILGDIASAYAAGETSEQFLLQQFAQLSGLPRDLAQLQAVWEQWLKSWLGISGSLGAQTFPARLARRFQVSAARPCSFK